MFFSGAACIWIYNFSKIQCVFVHPRIRESENPRIREYAIPPISNVVRSLQLFTTVFCSALLFFKGKIYPQDIQTSALLIPMKQNYAKHCMVYWKRISMFIVYIQIAIAYKFPVLATQLTAGHIELSFYGQNICWRKK